MEIADARVLTCTEGKTEASVMARMWRSAGVLRPWHAGRDTSENSGSPKGSRRMLRTDGDYERTMINYSSEMLEQESWWEQCRPCDRVIEADGVSYQAYYSKVEKAHYKGKDLTEVHSPQRKLVPDKVGLEKYEPTSLRG